VEKPSRDLVSVPTRAVKRFHSGWSVREGRIGSVGAERRSEDSASSATGRWCSPELEKVPTFRFHVTEVA